jgi:hypothetical protein
MPGMISHVLKRSGIVLNLLKMWQDDFVTIANQRDGFRASRKETGCHPTPPQALVLSETIFLTNL